MNASQNQFNEQKKLLSEHANSTYQDNKVNSVNSLNIGNGNGAARPIPLDIEKGLTLNVDLIDEKHIVNPLYDETINSILFSPPQYTNNRAFLFFTFSIVIVPILSLIYVFFLITTNNISKHHKISPKDRAISISSKNNLPVKAPLIPHLKNWYEN